MFRTLDLRLFVLFGLFAGGQIVFAQNSNVAKDEKRDRNANVSVETEKPAPSSKIRGRAVYEDTNKPVRRGQILLARSTPLEPIQKTITGDEGEFEFEKVAAGTYYFLIEVPGILNPNSYRSFYTSSSDDQTVSTTKLDKFFESVTVDGTSETQVIVRAKRAGAISGRVTYSDGEAAAGVRIEALRRSRDEFEGRNDDSNDGRGQVGTAFTDDRGMYRFAGLPPGEYIIFIRENVLHIDGRYREKFDTDSELKTYFPDAATAKEARILEIGLGREQSGINITIPDRKLFKISGTVLSKTDGKPFVGATVRFQKKDDRSLLNYRLLYNYNRQATTDENGRFLIAELPKGDYELTVSPPYRLDDAYRDATQPKTPPKPKFAEVKKDVRVEDKEVSELKIELPAEAVITGSISVEGKKALPNRVSIFAANDKLFDSSSSATIHRQEGETEIRKEFRLDGLVEGKITVLTFIEADEGFYVKSIRLGNTDLMTSPLEIKEGELIKGVEIILSDNVGTLRGKVQSGDPDTDFPRVFIARVGITEAGAFNQIRSAVANANGEFEIKAAPGEYYVYFYKYDSREEREEGETWNEWVKRQTEGAERITIKAGETSNIVLKLPKT